MKDAKVKKFTWKKVLRSFFLGIVVVGVLVIGIVCGLFHNEIRTVITLKELRPYVQAKADCDYQWVTNFIIQPDYYDSTDIKNGYDRYEKIYQELSKTNGVVKDEKAAMDILDQVSYTGNRTIYSVVYNLTEQSVLWVCHENYDDETAIFEFALE